MPRGTPEGAGAGRGRAKAGLSSPALPSPPLLGLLLPDQLPAGAACLGMSVAGAHWDLQGLQTVGIILLLCSSLKLLHVLGIIDLSRGGGTGMGIGTGMGLQWDEDVVVEVLLTSCPRGRVLGGGLEGLVCFGASGGGIRVWEGVWQHEGVGSWGSEGVWGLGCGAFWECWGAWGALGCRGIRDAGVSGDIGM